MKQKNFIHFTIPSAILSLALFSMPAFSNTPCSTNSNQFSNETTDEFDQYGHRILPDSIILFESFDKYTGTGKLIKNSNSQFDNDKKNYTAANCYSGDKCIKLLNSDKDDNSHFTSTNVEIDVSNSRLLNISCLAKGIGTTKKIYAFNASDKKFQYFDLTSEFTKCSYDVVNANNFHYGFGITTGAAYIDNFTITYKRIVVKEMTNGYCTIAAYPHSLVVPENTEAFTLTIKNSILYKGHVYKTGDAIPPREAVVLHNTTDQTIRLREVADEGQCDPNNLLHGADHNKTAYMIYPNNDKIDGSYYVLGRDGNKQNIGFYRYKYKNNSNGDFTMTPNRAFLFLPSTSAGAKINAFRLDETVTAINEIHETTKKTRKYNLCGQIVDESYKGIVIENGKKILVK